jgi:group I intron endonuclease
MKGIYCIKNKINGKMYVGLSNDIQRRFQEHKTPKNKQKTTNIAKALRKYGLDSFDFTVLEEVFDSEDLESKEIFWIGKLNPEYNMNKGGLGNTGRLIKDETRLKISNAVKLNWSQKTQQQKSDILKNLIGPKKGRQINETTKQKLRMANIGKKQSEETKLKRSLSMKKSMIGNSNGNKAVIGYTDDYEIEFESAKKAAIHFSISPGCITGVLKGRRKTAAKLKWKYKQ